MNLYFRFIWLLLSRIIVKTPVDLFANCTTRFRVQLLDLDLNLHVNNGRYLSIMDLGRFDLMLKSATFWSLAKQGYFPVVTSQSIRFKKALGPFHRFELISRIETWDEKDFYLRQSFVRDSVVYAEGFVKCRFLRRGHKGSMPTRDMFRVIGKEYEEGLSSERAVAQKHIESLLIREQ